MFGLLFHLLHGFLFLFLGFLGVGFDLLDPLLEFLFALLDVLLVGFVFLIRDHGEHGIRSLFRGFDLEEWVGVGFGGFALGAEVEVLEDGGFVAVSDDWVSSTSITNKTFVNSKTTFLS